MPNGGVPMHMVLHPKNGPLVFYCRAGEVRIFPQKDWTEKKDSATPLCTLSKYEASALAWQIRYWLGESALKPGYNMPRGVVNAEYDY